MRRLMMMVTLVGLIAAASGCYKPLDFDNDDRADFVVIDPSGTWIDLANPSNPPLHVGAPGDQWRAVPADYDGDGVTDVAVLTDAGDWVTQSDAGTIHFPAPPDLPGFTPNLHNVPVPADYDGNGHADVAWYRDTDGVWFINGVLPIAFGTGPTSTVPTGPTNDQYDQDFPVPADYDGDGTADLATYNPRTLVWKVRSSRDGSVSSVTMPGTNDVYALPAPGDYDGVHHAQRALAGSAGWQIEGHASPILFGNWTPEHPMATVVYPTAADYDGDGITDLSYVADDGVWYTRLSGSHATTVTYSVGDNSYSTMAAAANPQVQAIARFTLIAHTCSYYPADC